MEKQEEVPMELWQATPTVQYTTVLEEEEQEDRFICRFQIYPVPTSFE